MIEMNRQSIVLALIFLLFVVFIFGDISWKNNFVSIFNNPLGWWRNSDLIQKLNVENTALRAQISELKSNIVPFKSDTIEAKVFSSYPFNNKNLISINFGLERGIKELMPVTLGGHILIGQVIKVFKNYSLVRTIFSPDWEIPVRIGDKKIPALLVGGPELKLTMIVNDKPIFDGQVIFLAKKDLPYGLKIGEVVNVQNDSVTGVFQRASVKVDYDINDLTEVSVLLWTAD